MEYLSMHFLSHSIKNLQLDIIWRQNASVSFGFVSTPQQNRFYCDHVGCSHFNKKQHKTALLGKEMRERPPIK